MRTSILACITCIFLLIDTALCEEIGSDAFGCDYFMSNSSCMGYSELREQYLADYAAHITAIPDGMATCISNCLYPYISSTTGFYRKGSVVEYGDLSFLPLDYISLLPEELRNATDEDGYNIESELYQAVKTALFDANGDTVFVEGLGGFTLVGNEVAFTGNLLADPAAIGTVGSNYIGTLGSTAGYTYVPSNPASVTGVLKKLYIRVQSVGTGSINQLKVLSKSGTSFTVVSSTPIALPTTGLNEVTVNIPIQTGQYIGIYTSTTKLTYQTATGARSRITGNPSVGQTVTGTLQNYGNGVSGSVYNPPPPPTIPGVSISEMWTWAGTGYIVLMWHNGTVCYKSGCYDYDFSLRFKQVEETDFGRPIYLETAHHRNGYVWLAGNLRGGIKVYVKNEVISLYRGQNMEVAYTFAHSPPYWY